MIKRMFSLEEDTASHNEIRDRILSGGQITGVAIATTLMPSLCTCGYSIANGEWRMLAGAAYLFAINAYFIYMSSCIVLALLKIPHVKELDDAGWKKLKRKMIRNTILVLLPMILIFIHISMTNV